LLDEDDSFPPVATEPDDPHRPPPERQRVFMARRIGAVAGGIVLLVLLVLGFRGCLDARKERAFENYVRDLTTLTQESNQLGESFFGRFEDPGGRQLEFETAIRADRSNAEQLLGRAESLDPPGELSGVQERVELSFALRRDGLAAVADNIGTALSNESDAREESLEQITVHMQDFLASDFLFARAREEANSVLGEEGIEEKVPRSDFLPQTSDGAPDLEWLDATTVAEALGGVSGEDGGEGGVHGLGISSVLLGGTALAADTSNTVVAQGTPEMEVAIANQGDSEESDIPVTVTVSGGDEPVEAEETLGRIAPGETQTVTVPLDPAPPKNERLELEVVVEPVLDEQVAENNEFVADVTFE
jgi:hypothetical protein